MDYEKRNPISAKISNIGGYQSETSDNFLEIPFYKKHYYKNLKQLKVNNLEYNDSVYGGPLHTITTDKIRKQKIKVINKILDKYSGMEFWRNN